MTGHPGPAQVSVRILDREYLFPCSLQEHAELLDAADYLNRRLREIGESGTGHGTERIAVMAALHLARELLEVQSGKAQLESALLGQIRSLCERVEGALGAHPT